MRLLALLPGKETELAKLDLLGVLDSRGLRVEDEEVEELGFGGRLVAFSVLTKAAPGATGPDSLRHALVDLAYSTRACELAWSFKCESGLRGQALGAIAGAADSVRARLGGATPFHVRVKLESGRGTSTQALERELGAVLEERLRLPVSFGQTAATVLVFFVDDFQRAYVGVELTRKRRGPLSPRRHAASLRPYLQVGTLNPPFSRFLVNWSACSPRGTLLDPACGSGGVLLEAVATGRRAVGFDLDRRHLRGCRQNLAAAHGAASCNLVRASAQLFPFRPGAFDAVVADVPYDRSTSSRRSGGLRVFEWVARGAATCLVPGGRLVVSVADWLLRKPPEAPHPPFPAPPQLSSPQAAAQRVHKSLTRVAFRYERRINL
ncbi:MAG: hypothetical protein Kow0069_22610 [Promethearchaeota archaeon]